MEKHWKSIHTNGPLEAEVDDRNGNVRVQDWISMDSIFMSAEEADALAVAIISAVFPHLPTGRKS